MCELTNESSLGIQKRGLKGTGAKTGSQTLFVFIKACKFILIVTEIKL